MIRVGVRLDDVVDAHAALGGERHVAIELLEVRIDEHRRAGLVARDQVRQASATADLLEQHAALYHPTRWMPRWPRCSACANSSPAAPASCSPAATRRKSSTRS